MWLLKDSSGGFKYLKPNKTIKVGRKDADIILENDSSISRAHASITVTLKDEVEMSKESSICLIKDINSKYGSFIARNGTKVKVTKEGLELHHGDSLTFGLQNCTYTVEYIQFVTVVSRLSAPHKQKLKNIMDDIGGLMIDFFHNQCTHVTATTCATTTKIISGLIYGRPIVGLDYWVQVQKCIEENKALPDPNMFILSLQDKLINVGKVCMKPNPVRRTLFQNKTFIFFSEQSCNNYKEMITQAGGTAKVHPMSTNIPDDLFKDDYIVMKANTNDISAEEFIVFDTLLQNKAKEKNVRTINESELPLAVIYANLDQYCNPKFDFSKLFRRKGRVEDTSEVLALDTQEIECASTSKNTKWKVPKLPVVSETNDFQINSTQSQQSLLQDPEVMSTSDQAKHVSSKKPVEKNDNNRDKVTEPMKETFEKKANEKVKTSDSNLLKPVNSNSKRGDKEASSSNNEDDLSDKKKSKSNKRQREAEFDEINENIQQFWRSKKRNSTEDSKSKIVSEDIKDIDFIKTETESQVTESNVNKKSKTDKWGFKKTNKRVIDFDLDDDFCESNKIVKKSKNDVSDSSTRKIAKNFDLDDLDDNESETVVKKSAIDITDGSTDEFSKTKSSKRNHRAETVLEPEKDVEIKQNIQLKVKPLDVPKKKSHFITKNDRISGDEIDEEKNVMAKSSSVMSFKSEVGVDNLRCGKIFKKCHNQIPVTRVPLADMTIWRPN